MKKKTKSEYPVIASKGKGVPGLIIDNEVDDLRYQLQKANDKEYALNARIKKLEARSEARIKKLEARSEARIKKLEARSETAMIQAEEVYVSIAQSLKVKSRMLKCCSCQRKCLLLIKDEPLELNQIWKIPCPFHVNNFEWKITSINKQMKGKAQQFGEAGHNVFFDCDETGRVLEKWRLR